MIDSFNGVDFIDQLLFKAHEYHVIFLCYTSEKHIFVLHVRSQRSVTPAITNDPRHYQGNSDYCLSVALCPSAIIEFQEHARKYG